VRLFNLGEVVVRTNALKRAVLAALVCVGLQVAVQPAFAGPPVPIEHKWCVSATGSGPYTGCEGPASCSGEFTSIEQAIAAARIAPDPDPSDRPAHQVCVDSAVPHIESALVDNTDGSLGEYVGIEFTNASGITWCDDGDLGRSAGFEAVGSGASFEYFYVINARTDATTCARTRPMFDISNMDFFNSFGVVLGGPGPILLAQSSTPHQHGVGFGVSVVEGVTGPVVTSGTGVFSLQSVFAGNESSTGALIEMTGSTSPGDSNTAVIEMVDSVLVGNVVDGAPLMSSSEGLFMAASVVAGNVVLGAPLIEVGPASPSLRVKHLFAEVEVSENTLLAAGGIASAAPPVHNTTPASLFPTMDCGPKTLQGIAVADRTAAMGSGPLGDFSLLSFTSPGTPEEAYRIYRSYFVENELGSGGAVIDVGTSHISSEVFVLHNLFGPHAAPLLEARVRTLVPGASGSRRLGSVRTQRPMPG